MEVGRIVLAVVFFAFAGAAFFMFTETPRTMLARDAELRPSDGGFALSAAIINEDGPDRLTAITSESAGQVALMAAAPGLVVPAGAHATLAPGGAFAMLHGLQGGTEPGRQVPVTFWFEHAGKLTVRARIVDGPAPAPAPEREIPPDQPKPSLSVSVRPDGEDWILSVQLENFTLSGEHADAPYMPGVGYGQVYLNGLKLDSIHEPQMRIGKLLPGNYKLRVSLNSNDDRPFLVDGSRLTATTEFVVD